MEDKQISISLTVDELLIMTGSLISAMQSRGAKPSEEVKSLVSKLLETTVTNLSKEELQEVSDKYKISIM